MFADTHAAYAVFGDSSDCGDIGFSGDLGVFGDVGVSGDLGVFGDVGVFEDVGVFGDAGVASFFDVFPAGFSFFSRLDGGRYRGGLTSLGLACF